MSNIIITNNLIDNNQLQDTLRVEKKKKKYEKKTSSIYSTCNVTSLDLAYHPVTGSETLIRHGYSLLL